MVWHEGPEVLQLKRIKDLLSALHGIGPLVQDHSQLLSAVFLCQLIGCWRCHISLSSPMTMRAYTKPVTKGWNMTNGRPFLRALHYKACKSKKPHDFWSIFQHVPSTIIVFLWNYININISELKFHLCNKLTQYSPKKIIIIIMHYIKNAFCYV